MCPTGGGLHGQRRAVHLETTRRGWDDHARGSSAGERTQPSHRRGGNVSLAIPAMQTGSWHLSMFAWRYKVSDFDLWPLNRRTTCVHFGSLWSVPCVSIKSVFWDRKWVEWWLQSDKLWLESERESLSLLFSLPLSSLSSCSLSLSLSLSMAGLEWLD